MGPHSQSSNKALNVILAFPTVIGCSIARFLVFGVYIVQEANNLLTSLASISLGGLRGTAGEV